MANGLTTIDQQSLSVSNATELIPAIQAYGSMIAKGQLFGCKNEEQGQTLVLMSMSEGIPITEMRKRYHIIAGSDLSMRADYMLAEFERLGGWWDWINQGDDGDEAVLHVKYKHHDKRVKYTIDMAKKAGLVKPKSGWEKNPGEMLRARCQTKAIRMVCPKVLAGFATDQELDPDGDAIVVESSPANEPDRAASSAKVANAPAASPADGPGDGVVDAEFEVKPGVEGRATGPQLDKLRELFAAMSLPADVQLKAITSTGAADMGSLSSDGAIEIIAKLESKLKPAEPEPTGETVVESVEVESTDDACTMIQAAQLKTLVQALAQAEGGVEKVKQIKAHMDKSDLAKFTDLTTSEADALIAAIEKRDLSDVFASPFQGAAKKG